MASDVFRKLNLKDQAEIVVVNAPASFEGELRTLSGVAVRRQLKAPASFVLVFAITQADVDGATKAVAKWAPGDAIVWFAYPKGTSKRYRSEIDRDSGWKALGAAGFEGVRMVAIDEDWSAARFRRAEFIKTMTRHVSGTMSKTGRARVTK